MMSGETFMNTKQQRPLPSPVTRRSFLKTGAIVTAGLASLSMPARAQVNKNKHVYGQKPLVHQLSELRMMRDALAARPSLVTQMGNQRACNRGRMISVEILRKNQLGRPVEAWVWTGGVSRGHYFADANMNYPAGKPVPDYLSWDLWRGPIDHEMPYSEDLAPRRWRTFWETGGGQLADWGCHLLDLL